MTTPQYNPHDPYFSQGQYIAVLSEPYDQSIELPINVYEYALAQTLPAQLTIPQRAGIYRFTNERERNRFVARVNSLSIDNIAFIL